jgi:ABC-type xylose transport system permease subunit
MNLTRGRAGNADAACRGGSPRRPRGVLVIAGVVIAVGGLLSTAKVASARPDTIGCSESAFDTAVSGGGTVVFGSPEASP